MGKGFHRRKKWRTHVPKKKGRLLLWKDVMKAASLTIILVEIGSYKHLPFLVQTVEKFIRKITFVCLGEL